MSGILTSVACNQTVSDRVFGVRGSAISCVKSGYGGQILFQALTASSFCFFRPNMLLIVPEAGIQLAQEAESTILADTFNVAVLDKIGN